MIGSKRTILSVIASLALVAGAIAAVWLMSSAGLLDAPEAPLAPAPAAEGDPAAAPSTPFTPVGDGQGVSQPRDPFRPLILPPPTTEPSDTTTTVPGETTTTVPGDTTTTTASDTPDQIRIMLNEVRMEAGERVAVVTVDGVTYTVGVGDQFAGDFAVVSLTDTGGVFTYKGTAFTLAVGQSLLK